ncbi:hypothetical protein TSUD_176710 [Trifolium subterraneum]|uniref:Transmembrane protein n=1 Tax=Trifolium subterraneum TaxID=3900 RepID=A0A2Z6MFT8_TRISU|nr:hypothetical protein TSUD_176710 [Trifolium subterraneum]
MSSLFFWVSISSDGFWVGLFFGLASFGFLSGLGRLDVGSDKGNWVVWVFKIGLLGPRWLGVEATSMLYKVVRFLSAPINVGMNIGLKLAAPGWTVTFCRMRCGLIAGVIMLGIDWLG